MAIFKCKMCGGDLDVVDGMSVAECEYCGTKQTLPKLNDNEKEIMYDRAGHFRRNIEYRHLPLQCLWNVRERL